VNASIPAVDATATVLSVDASAPLAEAPKVDAAAPDFSAPSADTAALNVSAPSADVVTPAADVSAPAVDAKADKGLSAGAIGGIAGAGAAVTGLGAFAASKLGKSGDASADAPKGLGLGGAGDKFNSFTSNTTTSVNNGITSATGTATDALDSGKNLANDNIAKIPTTGPLGFAGTFAKDSSDKATGAASGFITQASTAATDSTAKAQTLAADAGKGVPSSFDSDKLSPSPKMGFGRRLSGAFKGLGKKKEEQPAVPVAAVGAGAATAIAGGAAVTAAGHSTTDAAVVDIPAEAPAAVDVSDVPAAAVDATVPATEAPKVATPEVSALALDPKPAVVDAAVATPAVDTPTASAIETPAVDASAPAVAASTLAVDAPAPAVDVSTPSPEAPKISGLPAASTTASNFGASALAAGKGRTADTATFGKNSISSGINFSKDIGKESFAEGLTYGKEGAASAGNVANNTVSSAAKLGKDVTTPPAADVPAPSTLSTDGNFANDTSNAFGLSASTTVTPQPSQILATPAASVLATPSQHTVPAAEAPSTPGDSMRVKKRKSGFFQKLKQVFKHKN
jgi:hypothetical protein